MKRGGGTGTPPHAQIPRQATVNLPDCPMPKARRLRFPQLLRLCGSGFGSDVFGHSAKRRALMSVGGVQIAAGVRRRTYGQASIGTGGADSSNPGQRWCERAGAVRILASSPSNRDSKSPFSQIEILSVSHLESPLHLLCATGKLAVEARPIRAALDPFAVTKARVVVDDVCE